MRTLEQLVSGAWSGSESQATADTEMLAGVLWDVVRSGRQAQVPADLSRFFGCRSAMTAGELWGKVADDLERALSTSSTNLVQHVVQHGCLAERILRAVGGDTRRERLREVYGDLCDCLAEGRHFGWS